MELSMMNGRPCAVYVIREGDSVASIAARYGMTPARILEMNPYIDPENLTVGQPICVPDGEACGNCCPQGYLAGTVRYGQTYEDLLIQYDVSYQAFRQANPRLSPNVLLPGQRYCLPPAERLPDCPNGATRVTIPEDGTLQSVSTDLRVSVGRLLRLNPTLRPSDFVEGRQICVPVESLAR